MGDEVVFQKAPPSTVLSSRDSTLTGELRHGVFVNTKERSRFDQVEGFHTVLYRSCRAFNKSVADISGSMLRMFISVTLSSTPAQTFT